MPRAPAVRGHPLPLSEGSGEGILIIESQKAAYLAKAESRILQILPRKKSPLPGDNFMECGAGRAQHALEGTPPHTHFRCRACGALMDLETVPYDETLDRAAAAQGYAVAGHSLVFTGCCPLCAGRQEPA